jgi:hypothetical protein
LLKKSPNSKRPITNPISPYSFPSPPATPTPQRPPHARRRTGCGQPPRPSTPHRQLSSPASRLPSILLLSSIPGGCRRSLLSLSLVLQLQTRVGACTNWGIAEQRRGGCARHVRFVPLSQPPWFHPFNPTLDPPIRAPIPRRGRLIRRRMVHSLERQSE